MLKITTYPNGKLTKFISKADAGKRCIEGIVEQFSSLKELTTRAAEVPITPSIMKDNKRLTANFIEAHVLVVDVDDVMDITECLALLDLKQVEFALYTSFSHTEERNKFHVILPTAEPITTVEDYKATYEYVTSKIFDKVNDGQTSSVVNLFFNGNPDTLKLEFSQKLETITRIPVIKGKKFTAPPTTPVVVQKTPSYEEKFYILSRATKEFLSCKGQIPNWHQQFILACKNLKAVGFSKEEATTLLQNITGELTEGDLYQINYAYKNDSWNYHVINAKPPHPLRVRYTDERGKRKNIPAREIVEAYINENNVSITAGGNIKSGVNETDLSILKEYIRDFAETELETKVSLSVIESVIASFREAERLKQLDKLTQRIKYNGTTFDWNEWSTALIGKVDKITIAVMKHFVWQIKRKLADKDVKYPIMPVFYGKSGAGKSYHIRNHILKPVKEVSYMDGDFVKLVDNREAYNLVSHYIYFLDEMAKVDNADIETIKNKITSDTIQYRKLGTNETVKGTNRVTFIGTSNNPLHSLIKDPTSIRRFFEIRISERMDFKKISSLDYEAMWKSIDESIGDDPFFMQHREEIETKQETFRHRSPIEEFLLENPYINDETIEGERVDRKTIYDQFRVWQADCGYRYSINKHSFINVLKEKLGEPVLHNSNLVYIKKKQ